MVSFPPVSPPPSPHPYAPHAQPIIIIKITKTQNLISPTNLGINKGGFINFDPNCL
jgi:hypothetical protein